MKDIGQFYKNKKVLITGHTGFKGSWLSIWLNQMGADIVGIALDPVSDRDLFKLSGLGNKITDYRQDIRNLDKIKNIFNKEQPEIVFHLAAQALVIPSYADPVFSFETNIMGTVNILEACRITESVRQVVIVTTDKVYENKEQLAGYKETDSLGGHDPYSASKAGAEIVTQSYYQSFFQSSNYSSSQSFISSMPDKSVSSARAGNVIGGGDWSLYRLLPDCIRSLEQNKPVIIRNPDAIRPWQHVLEPLNGYLHLAFRMSEEPVKYSGAWNFGPEEDGLLSVRDLVENVLAYWGKGTWEEEVNTSKHHETAILKLNINNAKHILGWKPVLDFKETIGMTMEWYKNYSDTDVYQLCCEQINDFSSKWNSGKRK